MLVEEVLKHKAEELVSDVTLRIAGSRTADQSTYELTLVSSAQDHQLRAALFEIMQAGALPTNSRDVPLKVWEIRAYRRVLTVVARS